MYGDGKQTNPGACHGEARLPASCCELLLPSFVWRASMHMAGRKQRSLFLWTAAESKRIPSRSSCRSLHAQFVQTLKHETVNYHNKQSPTVPYPKCSLRYALRVGRKSFIPTPLRARSQITTSRAARAQWWFGNLLFGLGNETLTNVHMPRDNWDWYHAGTSRSWPIWFVCSLFQWNYNTDAVDHAQALWVCTTFCTEHCVGMQSTWITFKSNVNVPFHGSKLYIFIVVVNLITMVIWAPWHGMALSHLSHKCRASRLGINSCVQLATDPALHWRGPTGRNSQLLTAVVVVININRWLSVVFQSRTCILGCWQASFFVEEWKCLLLFSVLALFFPASSPLSLFFMLLKVFLFLGWECLLVNKFLFFAIQSRQCTQTALLTAQSSVSVVFCLGLPRPLSHCEWQEIIFLSASWPVSTCTLLWSECNKRRSSTRSEKDARSLLCFSSPTPSFVSPDVSYVSTCLSKSCQSFLCLLFSFLNEDILVLSRVLFVKLLLSISLQFSDLT